MGNQLFHSQASHSRRLQFFTALILLVLFSSFLLLYTRGKSDVLHNTIFNNESGPTTNATLQFQKIFAISLPSRTDRQDALTLMSVLSGLEIDIAAGVRGEDVLEKTIPKDPKTEMKPGFAGSWRAHLNIMKRIVDEKISTALIMEDDIDWDIRVREQMGRVMNSLMTAQLQRDSIFSSDSDWEFPKDDDRKVVFSDLTVPGHEDLSPGFNTVKSLPEHVRVIHPTDFPVCTYAYAVSYAGAQKILYHAGLDRVVANFDTDLGNNCWLYMNCLSVTPPLFHFDRNKGLERDSDTDPDALKHNREPGNYKNIDRSVRDVMRERFGQKLRKDREWRPSEEYSPYFIEAMDLPGQ